jgi:hypothetical protein
MLAGLAANKYTKVKHNHALIDQVHPGHLPLLVHGPLSVPGCANRGRSGQDPGEG